MELGAFSLRRITVLILIRLLCINKNDFVWLGSTRPYITLLGVKWKRPIFLCHRGLNKILTNSAIFDIYRSNLNTGKSATTYIRNIPLVDIMSKARYDFRMMQEGKTWNVYSTFLFSINQEITTFECPNCLFQVSSFLFLYIYLL